MIATIICEGKSEYNYIQTINRILRIRGGVAPVFHPEDARGGFFQTVRQKLTQVQRSNRKGTYKIWVDRDIYIRNERGSGDKYNSSGMLQSFFLFSVMNFEDFIMLHCEDSILQAWCDECYSQASSINSPLTEKEYLPKFKTFFPKYKKGYIPMEINKDVLCRCFKHQNDPNVIIKNDFAVYLEELLTSGEIEYK